MHGFRYEYARNADPEREKLLDTMTDHPNSPVLERRTGFFEHINRYHRLHGRIRHHT
ncbi:hypothetical protein [Nonomuraea longicatena]|uniref:Transposase n=1 Tax=Nonomuraea longicatena TaxID=83682 RepID=A0ABP4ARY9_9ACTN